MRLVADSQGPSGPNPRATFFIKHRLALQVFERSAYRISVIVHY